MLDKIINIYFNFLKKWYIPVLIIFLLISGFLGYFGNKIEMKSDFADLLSDDNPIVKNMKIVFDKFGGEGFLICTLEYKHEFYGIDENFKQSDNIFSVINDLLKKWDPYDVSSTLNFLPNIYNHIIFAFDYINTNLKIKFNNYNAILVNEKAKKANQSFINEIDQGLQKLQLIFSIMDRAKQKGLTGENILKSIYTHLNSNDPEKAYNFIKNHIDAANYHINFIKNSIKSQFINFKAMEKAADEIVNAINQKNLLEVKFISYRKPVRWMKDNFFYLIDYKDLKSLHHELKKIHLSAIRILGSDKFQSIRNILNKYSVNISGEEEEETNFENQKQATFTSQHSNTQRNIIFNIK